MEKVMGRHKVYLSGKMGGLTPLDVIRMRGDAKFICDRLGLDYYDPAGDEGLEFMDPYHVIDSGVDMETMAGYVSKDEGNLDKCTVCLVLTGDTPSDGTWWEMARAKYVLKIPIIMVAPKRAHHAIVGFSNFHADKIFETTEGALAYIRYGLPVQETADAVH